MKHVVIPPHRAFEFRTVECPDCWEGRYEIPEGPGYVSCICETCDGEGEIDAECADCGERAALDDEGYCRRCFDKSALTVAEFNERYGPRVSLVEVEHLPNGGIIL
jgi:RecJ-like exonuclease